MLKVVTPEQMRAIEAQSISAGVTQESLMEQAGKQTATWVANFVKEKQLPPKAFCVAGKGNNGGDGYVVARYLLQLGFSVQVMQVGLLDPNGLVKKQRRRYEARGGKVHDLDHGTMPLPQEGVIVDALFGTGFRGKADEKSLQIIRSLNQLHLPIISVDVPSGLDAETGHVDGEAIMATVTCTMELAKTGFFFAEGFNHVGEVICLPIGLANATNASTASLMLLEESDVKPLLPKITRSRHKYEAGHVVGLAGSHGMTGAALLASYAALRAGAGIVHLLHREDCNFEFVGSPLEIVRVPYLAEDIGILRHWLERANASFIGPGLGTHDKQAQLLEALWPDLHSKMVIDADALNWLSSAKGKKFGPLPQAILTPHLGELQRFLLTKEPVSLQLLSTCQTLVDENSTNLVLKGGPSFLFSANEVPVVMMRGDPGMATAGSGDVLTGILASLLAQGLSAREAMLLGTYLHGLAGELAAAEETSYCMVASSITSYLSTAYKRLMLDIKRPNIS